MSLVNRILFYERVFIKDNRGWFLKIITGKEDYLPANTGEIYLTSAKPGEVKGEHYHLLANEWFTLIKGKCKLKLYDIDEEENFEIFLEDKLPKTIFIPPRIAHSFENISNENYMLVVYTDKFYDPSDTIKFDFNK